MKYTETIERKIPLREIARVIATLPSDEFAELFHLVMEEGDSAEKEWVAKWEANGKKGFKPSISMQRCYSADACEEHHRATEFFQEMGYYCRTKGSKMRIIWE